MDLFVVDDNPTNIRRLADILKGEGYRVRAATAGLRALEAIRAQPPDLVLLDIELPDLDGFEVCRALRREEATRELPVVFVSAHDGSAEKARAYGVGGADYLKKPFDADEVRARVAAQLEVVRLTRENRALRAELEALRGR